MSKQTPSWLQGFAIFMAAAMTVCGQTATNRAFASRTEQAFFLAKSELSRHPNDPAAAWHLGRASFDWALFATNTDQHADVARTGIAACQQAIALVPDSAPAHYYLAMDYGELADAEQPSLAAYRLIKDIEREFKLASTLDERIDFGGPPRSLGMLYRDAPGWPISIGNKHKAREYLEHAASLFPDFPENQLVLVESYLHWHQREEAESAWKKLSALWPAAQTNFTGAAWEQNWDDWTTRRTEARADFQKAFKRTLEP
jgi:tetratricopeptide (TPR) repeat protein